MKAWIYANPFWTGVIIALIIFCSLVLFGGEIGSWVNFFGGEIGSWVNFMKEVL